VAIGGITSSSRHRPLEGIAHRFSVDAGTGIRLSESWSVERVGGYRLIRRLGSGERAEVFLGVAGRAETSGLAPEPRTVAIKRFRQGADQHSIDVEMAAISRVSSPHVIRLLDVSSEPSTGPVGDPPGEVARRGFGRPCLILQRLATTGLARLLSDRSSIEAGEAVTILAPIAGAIGELHRAGVSHGGVRASSILFDDSAAPVLAGFGHATLFWTRDDTSPQSSPTAAQLAAELTVNRDLQQLTALVSAVLGLVRRADELPSVRELKVWLDVTDPAQIAGDFASQLVERLFELSPALPLRLSAPASEQLGVELPMRLGMSSSNVPVSKIEEAVSPARHDWMSVLHLPDWLEEGIARTIDESPVRTIMRTLKKKLRLIRKPAWFAVAVVGVLLLVVFAALPASDSAGGSAASPSPSISTRSAPTPTTSAAPQRSDPAVNDAITGEDPVSALAALLEERSSCIRTLSVLCLGGVDQGDSAALDADRALVRTKQEGGAVPAESVISVRSIRLVNRMGNSALLNIDLNQGSAPRTASASVLLMKGTLGWRIRDILIAAG
jgi:serine/threonine protein kinase